MESKGSARKDGRKVLGGLTVGGFGVAAQTCVAVTWCDFDSLVVEDDGVWLRRRR